MNTKFLSALTATAVATALFGATAPAQAGHQSPGNQPPSLGTFGTGGISFNNNTQVIFNFRQSVGAFQSSLGVYAVNGGIVTSTPLKTLFSEVKPSDSGEAGKWKGTLGTTVLGSGIATFTFLANQIYTLGLNSNPYGTVYSTSALNGGTQQAVFGNPNVLLPLVVDAADMTTFAGNPAAYTNGVGDLFNGGTAISFDDRGNGNDVDFQDFTLTAEAVPEPMTMTGLALGLGGLVAARRRRGSKMGS